MSITLNGYGKLSHLRVVNIYIKCSVANNIANLNSNYNPAFDFKGF